MVYFTFSRRYGQSLNAQLYVAIVVHWDIEVLEQAVRLINMRSLNENMQS